MSVINVLGLSIDNVSLNDVLARPRRFVFPVNVDVLMKWRKDTAFANVIAKNRESTYLLLDSQVMQFAVGMFFGKQFMEKISGSDLLPWICEEIAENDDGKIFFLGGEGETAKTAANKINQSHRRDIVVGAISPSWGFEKKQDENEVILQKINDSGATIVAVGVGAPKQEKWIYAHAHKLPKVKMFIAVGATLDFLAGNIHRAPSWISKAGLEWLYRLFQDPKRLAKRYLIDDTPFFWHLLLQRLRS